MEPPSSPLQIKLYSIYLSYNTDNQRVGRIGYSEYSAHAEDGWDFPPLSTCFSAAAILIRQYSLYSNHELGQAPEKEKPCETPSITAFFSKRINLVGQCHNIVQFENRLFIIK